MAKIFQNLFSRFQWTAPGSCIYPTANGKSTPRMERSSFLGSFLTFFSTHHVCFFIIYPTVNGKSKPRVQRSSFLGRFLTFFSSHHVCFFIIYPTVNGKSTPRVQRSSFFRRFLTFLLYTSLRLFQR